MSFFKTVLATVLGLFVFALLFLLVLLPLTVGIIGASSSDQVAEVKEQSVLYFNLSGQISERIPEDPFSDFIKINDQTGIDLLSTLRAIESAEVDPNIEGIYMEHGFLSGGYGSLEEIRLALLSFKETGKFVYSYGEYMGEGNYYLASVADEIYLNPQGILELNGLSANITFFKGLFEKLDIEPQIFRVGEFKSAIEPFSRKNMSEANRRQTTSFLNSIYDYYLQNVSISRNIALDKLKNISDSMLIRKPEDAFTYGLVSKVAFEDEMKALLKSTLELEDKDKINFISIGDYSSVAKKSEEYSSNKVAIIVADGAIVSGKGDTNSVGSDKFARAIRKARENKRVKAVVIRINSPGGSMLASDVMWREIMLTKAVKPVIASMSSVAASGGYYMAMPCDTIVAQPNTITGSIGIFGMLFNMSGLLENKLGITSDVVSTGKFSDIYTVSRPLSDMEKSIIQTGVNNGYETFTAKAAEGRNMDQDELKKVASGRVWTGLEAKERGLVDVLGTFNDAVDLAAQAAGIEDDYMITYYPELKSTFEELFGQLLGEQEAKILQNEFGTMGTYVEAIKKLEEYKGIQARLPYDLEIK